MQKIRKALIVALGILSGFLAISTHGLAVRTCDRELAKDWSSVETGLEVTVHEGRSSFVLLCDDYRHQTTRCGWVKELAAQS